MKWSLWILVSLVALGCARSAVKESVDLICPGNKLVTVHPGTGDRVSLEVNEAKYTLTEQLVDKGQKFSGSGYRLYLLNKKYYLAFPGKKKARFCRD